MLLVIKITKIFLVIFTLSFTVSAKNYHFSSIESLAEQEIGKIVLPQLYSKLGITLTIEALPAKRAEYYASAGHCDGEIMRIFDHGVNNSNIIRVPTPYYKLETMVFTKVGSNININNIDDLQHYKIAIVRGVKHLEKITQALTNVIKLNSTQQMMKFLNSNRADIAITNTTDGLLVLKKLKLKNIKPIGKPLATLDLYHYVHYSNSDLVDQIDHVIQASKKSGELDNLIRSAENKVLGLIR